MKKAFFIPISILLVLMALRVVSAEKSDKKNNYTTLSFEVDEHVLVRHPSKIGINLGNWSSVGSLSLSRNIIMNPGLEGRISRRMVLVSQNDENSFSDEAGLGDPDRYWDEAEFDIRTGSSAGKKGVVKRSLRSGANGLPQYFSKDPIPSLSSQDIIVLTKLSRPLTPDFWTINDRTTVKADPYHKRPDSEGTQSIRLTPRFNVPAVVVQTLDATAERTGKLIKIDGAWIFSFWAKGEKSGAQLEVLFQRGNRIEPFINQSITLEPEWKKYDLSFEGKDTGEDSPLKFALKAPVGNGSIWIDELWLGKQSDSSLAYSEPMVQALKRFKPSFLRAFPSLGDTFENLITAPSERRTWKYQLLGSYPQPIYPCAMSEFLDLCEEVGANPWVILPPVFSDYESREMAAFLAEKASKARFSDVIVEFGYENWNWLYRPFTIPYPAINGLLANRMLDILKKGVEGKVNLRTFVNGQSSTPYQALSFLESASKADGLAIAPNILETFDKGTPDEEVLQTLFQDDPGNMQVISDQLYVNRKDLAVYEVNLHTTKGSAKSYERNRVVAGMAAGTALAKRLMESLFAGANPIMVYNLGQHEIPTWELNDYVRLSGIVRDFGPPLKLRPTGLSVYMLNQVIGGNLHVMKPIGEQPSENQSLTLAAFKTPESWTAAIVSSHDSPLNAEILFPSDRHPLPSQVVALSADSPFDTNETEENVKADLSSVTQEGRVIQVTVPARSFVILKE